MVEEVRAGGYTRVALQFLDEILGESTRVYELVLEGINRETRQEPWGETVESEDKAESREAGYNGDGDCATDTLPKPTHNRETSTAKASLDTKACSCKTLSALQNAQPTTTVTPTSEPKKAFN